MKSLILKVFDLFLLLFKKVPFQECGRCIFICGVLNQPAACPYLYISVKSSHVGKSLVMTYNKIKLLWCELCFHLQPEWDVKAEVLCNTCPRKHQSFLYTRSKSLTTTEVDSLYQWHMLCMNNQWTTSLKDVMQNHPLCSMYQAVHSNGILLHSIWYSLCKYALLYFKWIC